MKKLILEFPTEAHRQTFIGWFLDGGGEQDYFDHSEDHETTPISNTNYIKPFEQGNNPAIDGNPKITMQI